MEMERIERNKQREKKSLAKGMHRYIYISYSVSFYLHFSSCFSEICMNIPAAYFLISSIIRRDMSPHIVISQM